MTRRSLRHLLFLGLLLICLNLSALADSLTFTFALTPPSGNVTGPAGSTIGWGYTISNLDPTNWLVTTNLTAAPFAEGTPDASLFDFPVIAPLSTVSVLFDASSLTGLYGFTWDSGAPVGFSNTGVFTLSGEWWTGDPATSGNFLRLANDATAAYSATVSSPVVVSVPEPSFIAMTVVSFLIIGMALTGFTPFRMTIKKL